jgi:hypothetical protein
MLVVPNVPERLGRFDPTTYRGDYRFIAETAQLMGEPLFVDRVVARIRPDGRPRLVVALDRALGLTPRVEPPRAIMGRALRRLRARGPGVS